MKLLLIILSSLVFFSCKPSEKTTKSSAELVKQEAIAVAELNSGNNGAFLTRENKVIRNEAELKAVWDDAFKNSSKKGPLPEVDFTKNIVVLVALGERNSGGYHINFKSASLKGDNLAVVVEETSPGATCMLTTAMTYSYQIVQLNCQAKNVTFTSEEKVMNCD